jgi:iron complex outermembrane receptor protein
MVRVRHHRLIGAITGALAVAGLSTATRGQTEPSAAQAQPNAIAANPPAADPRLERIGSMDLEQLMQLEIQPGTLTRTELNLVPAAVTTIDQAAIRQASPHSLYELLDIYVPDMYWTYHMWEMPHIGFRGIISDRDDKYLLLVNDRVMNERTARGVLSERDLVLMDDLHQVNVIRGPGSAIYGPGAVSGIVQLETESGLTYQGTGINLRAGAFEEFYSLEMKHGEKTSPDSGWFVYGGVAKYNGADHEYSPFVQGFSFPADYGDVEAGEPMDYPFADLHSTYQSNPQLKFHAQYDSGGLTMWTRYTFGGSHNTITERGWLANSPAGWLPPIPPAQVGIGYQQITGFAGYKRPINQNLSIDVSTSLDFTEYQRTTPTAPDGFWSDTEHGNSTEAKSINKFMLHWTPVRQQQIAAGIEFEHRWFGLESLRSPGEAMNGRFGLDTPRWETNMISFVAEHQWNISPQWTTSLGGRADKHTFTDWLFSPRAAVAYSPTSRDTVKLIGSQSLRTNTEDEMKYQDQLGNGNSDPEVMKTLELRYERQQNSNLLLASSVFYNDLEVLGWNDAAKANNILGSYRMIGAEGEVTYRSGDTAVTFSHSFVKLLDLDLDNGVSTSISANPSGYGRDLANWPEHMTKLTLHRDFDRKWSGDASVRVDWNFPGDQDLLRHANDNPVNGLPSSYEGWKEPYGPSVFLNLGLQCKLNQNATVRLDAYNVLGWIDHAFNKRDFIANYWQGDYRAEAASLGVSFRYEF